MNKDTLRTEMLTIRMALTENQRKELSDNAVSLIQNHPLYQSATHIGIYHPIKNELDVLNLRNDSEKHFYLPKVFGHHMHYLKFEETLEESELGIFEPRSNKSYDKVLELIIVPALAVDHSFHRVGYGKGYFDRYLSMNPNIKTLGVVMSFQVVEKITHSRLDVTLHDIIVIPYQGEEST